MKDVRFETAELSVLIRQVADTKTRVAHYKINDGLAGALYFARGYPIHHEGAIPKPIENFLKKEGYLL